MLWLHARGSSKVHAILHDKTSLTPPFRCWEAPASLGVEAVCVVSFIRLQTLVYLLLCLVLCRAIKEEAPRRLKPSENSESNGSVQYSNRRLVGLITKQHCVRATGTGTLSVGTCSRVTLDGTVERHRSATIVSCHVTPMAVLLSATSIDALVSSSDRRTK